MYPATYGELPAMHGGSASTRPRALWPGGSWFVVAPEPEVPRRRSIGVSRDRPLALIGEASVP